MKPEAKTSSLVGEDEETSGWLDGVLEAPALRQLALGIVHWADANGVVHRLVGDEIAFAFPWLPASEGWLTVAPLDGTVIVRFARLNGYPPFGREAMSRLIKRINHEGFVKRSSGGVFARVPLTSLKDELELKALLWRLDMILELAENSKPG
jgi:hypothetical protein